MSDSGKFLLMVGKQLTFGLNDLKVQYTAQIYFEKTHMSYKNVVSLHIGNPRSARVGPEVPSFDCMGSTIPSPV